jgi:hypothetical protein
LRTPRNLNALRDTCSTGPPFSKPCIKRSETLSQALLSPEQCCVSVVGGPCSQTLIRGLRKTSEF